MLDLLGYMTDSAAIAVNLIAILTVLPLKLRQRLTAAGVAGAWIGLASALGASGALAYSPAQPFPIVGALFATPLLATLAFALGSRGFREALLAIPTELLIGLNALRVLGVLFLALLVVGRLSGPFPYFAGIGDILTGLLAIPLARRVARGEPASIGAWNAFGALDLFVAIGLGLTSGEGGPLQIFHVGAGSLAMQSLPFSLVPTVLVPFYLIVHATIAAQLLARRKAPVLKLA
ncbi:MAG: hypothetical protein E7774_01795 [Bradyrhizobium sp.]|nr:MAG: hypothetical protein E7774_01795 [Bradyrhizobium sp.]